MPTPNCRIGGKRFATGTTVRGPSRFNYKTTQGGTVGTWQANRAWPSKWKVNGFDGKGNDVVTEEITFVVEEILIEG